MNKIELTGQSITGTNYATDRLFNFTPERVKDAAESFLASGITKIEIPEGVLNPDGPAAGGCDEKSIRAAAAGMPGETSVIGTYLGNEGLGSDNVAFLESKKRSLDCMMEYFPDMKYAMLHPPEAEFSGPDDIRRAVDTWLRLGEYAVSRRPGFQLCFHNHYDSGGETAEQVRGFLSAMAEADFPGLRWGVDTAQSDGMGDEHLAVLEEYAGLIGNCFHIKARVPVFDRLHGGGDYRVDRDIWSRRGADPEGGLYCGAVNPADPEITTPFEEIFRIIREKARPAEGDTVYGALEIDNPRQHPRLEAMCGALYLKNVHGIEGAMALSNDEIISRVFRV